MLSCVRGCSDGLIAGPGPCIVQAVGNTAGLTTRRLVLQGNVLVAYSCNTVDVTPFLSDPLNAEFLRLGGLCFEVCACSELIRIL
jgi:hypothetical protein